MESDPISGPGEGSQLIMSDNQNIQPPKWPLRLLRFFVRKEYLEEIEGDMEEVFQDNLLRMPARRARRQYMWDVLKLFRPILMRSFLGVQVHSQQAMFVSYFKVSFRGLMKSPLNSAINVFGLAATIGICVFSYAFARWTFNTDQFHKLKNEVYLVTFFADREGAAQQYGTTPRPLGEMLRHDVPAIKKVCRIEDRSVIIKHVNDVFYQRIRFTDPEFLQLLTFPMKWGSAASLTDPNSIILSEQMSEKFFGDANPIGTELTVFFDKDNSKVFKVTGVAAEFPKSRTISFTFLVNIENLRTAYQGYDAHDWNTFANATLIQVPNPAEVPSVLTSINKYKAIQNKASNDEWAIRSFALEPLATLHEHAGNIRDNISRSSDSNYATIGYLIFVCLLLLILSCFNYINIAIVTAAKRLKEIGLRKTIGASRKSVVVQFLTENIVVTTFAMLIGIILALTIFIPGFEKLWSFSMDFSFADRNLWIYLPLILLITGLASGFYPAIYISRFQVAGILKGTVKFGRKNPLTKVFLVLQLIVACIFITTALMFTQNSSYLARREWGYNQSTAMYAVAPDPLSFEQLKTAMSQVPNVVSVAGSQHHLGKSLASTVLHFPDREVDADRLAIGGNYFETMGLQLKSGRPFNDFDGSDRHSVIVNEMLANTIGWQEPIGQTFRIDSISYQVVGVVRDFHMFSFAKKMRPMIFTVAEKEELKYLSLQVTSGAEIATYKKLQDKWAELFPEIPFDGGLQEDVWGFYFEEISIHQLVWRILAFIAITLAVLGLYGLISINVEGRVREFSVRKVLGAGWLHITRSVLNQYLLLFTIALVVGAPLGYFISSTIINAAYNYHMPITYFETVLAAIILTLIVLITVSTQVSKVLKANPVEGLKAE